MRDSAAGAGSGQWTSGMRIAGAVLLACALLAAGDGAAAAQAGEGRACFQPRPMPVCRSFWVTEFGVQYFVNRPPGIDSERRLLGTWELGWMRNRASGDAVGGSIFLSTNDHAHRSGVRARYRRWMAGETSLDLSPALIVFQSDEDLEVRTELGAALQLAVSHHDWIGLTTQVEAASGGVRLQTGVRLGGFPGVAAGVGLPLVALLGADDS
ncbi:MAG: hypothetical protein ACJ8GN_13950 [Longimicrobiaceae bacterium]